MIFISGKIRYHIPMKCTHCTRGFQSSHYIEFDERILTAKAEELIERHFRNCVPNIPVGWAMFGRGDVRCPAHVEGAE